jgi:hypothetical protein
MILPQAFALLFAKLDASHSGNECLTVTTDPLAGDTSKIISELVQDVADFDNPRPPFMSECGQ